MRWLEVLGYALVGKPRLRIGNLRPSLGKKQWVIVEVFHLIAVFVSPDPFSGPTDAALNGLPL